MDGHFKPKFKNERKELYLLELNDCYFVPDDEVVLRSKLGRKHSCPRCGDITHIVSNDPYCTGCNWDSLTDPTYERAKCVA